MTLNSLWRLEGPAIADVVAGLLGDPDQDVRRKAIEILAMTERPQDLPAFARALADHATSVCVAARGGLSRQLKRPDRAKLLELLAGAPDQTRHQALIELRSMGTERSVADLVEELISGDSSACEGALIEICRRNLDSEEVTKALLSFLRHPDHNRRKVSVEALALFASSDAVLNVRPLLQDPELEVQKSAASTLAALGDSESAGQIAKWLDDPNADPGMQEAACRALGTLGLREYARQVEELIRDGNADLGEVASEALAMMDAKEAASSILSTLGQNLDRSGISIISNSFPRSTDALGRLGDDTIALELEPRLRSRYWAMRADAAAALGAMGRRESVPQLIALLEDCSPFVRGEAARALGRLGAQDAIVPLRKLLEKDGIGSSEKTWGEVTGPSAVEAVHALACLGAKQAAPELLGLLRSHHEEIRTAAFSAIRRLHLKAVLSDVLKLLSDPELYGENDNPMRPEGRGRFPGHVEFRRVWIGANETPGGSVFVPDLVADLGATDYIPDLIQMLPWLSSSDRVATAAALCRLGSRKGIPIVLGAAEWSDCSGLPSLNALRKPSLWTLLQETPFRGTRARRKEELWREVGKALGMRCEVPRRIWWGEPGRNSGIVKRQPSSICDLSYVSKLEDEGTMLNVIKSMCGALHSFILEDGRVCVIRNDEALAFWRSWWLEEEKKGRR
jgi:HEAT repeat protein